MVDIYLSDFNKLVEYRSSLFELIGSDDFGGYPIANSIESFDHLNYVGGNCFFVFLCPALVEELPRSNSLD